MDKELLAMLVCPLCNGKLKYDRDAQELRCHYDGLAYPIQEGIPVMLPEEARPMDVDEKLHTSPGRSPGSAQESSQESSRESSPPSSQTGASGHPGGA